MSAENEITICELQREIDDLSHRLDNALKAAERFSELWEVEKKKYDHLVSKILGSSVGRIN